MNEYEKFCIEEAKFYMDKAHHILNEEMKDPKKSYRPIKLRAIDDNDLSVFSPKS